MSKFGGEMMEIRFRSRFFGFTFAAAASFTFAAAAAAAAAAIAAAAAVRVYSSFIKRGTKGFWGEECLMEWCFAGETRPPSISRGGASCLKMLQ